MPTARRKSASPTKHTAFALSAAQPSQRRGAWRPPPVYLADGKTVYQDYVRPPPDADGEAPEDAPEMYMAYIGSDVAPLGPQTTHSRLRGKQTRRWMEEVFPVILPVYADLVRHTERLRHLERVMPYTRECICGRQRDVQVYLLSWHDVQRTLLTYCACCPAAPQLVARGLFPSSPIEPHQAVDMRVLDFAQDLFLNQAPNNRALTKTIKQCLDRLGYKLPNRESLRRQFGNTLEYYTILRHRTDQAMDDILQSMWEEMRKEEEHCKRPSTPTPSPHRGAEESPRKRRRRKLESSPPSSPTKRTRALSSSPTRAFMPPSSSPGPSPEQSSSPGPSSPIAESSSTAGPIYPFPTPQDRVQPSEYLHGRCPACFGGKWEDARMALHCIVCGDACFMQKRNKDRGQQDPVRAHPKSSFLPDEATEKMAQWVEGICPTRPAPGSAAAPTQEANDDDEIKAPSIPLPRSVLNECERSFAAADETRAKSSSQFFDDKGLMGLSCRHDNLLFLANIKTPGKCQFYMFALIEALLQHLPTDFVVGFLYNIACQLQRSAVKFDFLPPAYMERLEWAVSVLHLYGHGAACQAVYHPRRRTHFGFSDGESLERFWHSLSHLVSFLRVCGYHKRRYMLDAQVIHLHKGNLSRLGTCQCPHEELVLWAEHAKQVAAMSKPQPRQSKNAGKLAVQDVLRKTLLMDKLKAQMSQWNDTIFKEDADPIYVHFAEQEYAKAHEKLSKLAESVHKQKATMGVEDKADLSKMVQSKYIQVRMNAAATKTKLRSRLRQRKFELDRVEHAKLTTHIEDAVKRRDRSIKDLCKLYNNLCKQLQELIDLHRAPRNAVAPGPINEKDIWGLDVDADVWLDIGLTDINEEVDPPLWMSSDSVRKGIQALLERDRCDKEEPCLHHKCRALRWWMAEEWDVVGRALQLAGKANEEAVVFQLKLRQSELTKLTAAWEKPLRQIPYPTEGLPPWGPSDRDVLQIRIEDVSAHTRDGAPSWGNDEWKDTNGDEDSGSETESNGESLPYDELEAFERGGIVWDEELLS
ncbi:unnamed protein product [Mycena citricolor]|uniref:CxC1-like cysteine cluster associated with KDZ transposases domain-containing protein n=1 Tax=Mycena citricolor TaxID=2018698 RepID=A0AAD2Q2R0_9AGAR|nr:unnamed protein product [Mycena citricolor]